MSSDGRRSRHVHRLPRGKRVLLIFVKAPSPGQVKTRLLPILSGAQAAHLYRCLVQDTLAIARTLRDVRVAIAYAANAQFPDCSWLDVEVPVVLQEGAHLGERLLRAFRWAFQQDAAQVVAIGSDAPQLSARWLRQAFRALERADVVLGPTTDGGYHLIGLNDPNPALFVDMPWSTDRLLAKTLERLEHLHLTAHCLEPVMDLDTPEDLRRYVGRLNGQRPRTPVRARLGRAGGQTARYLAALCLDRAHGRMLPGAAERLEG